MKKYKVVHLIWHEDTNLKFYSCLIEMINSHFSKKDHLFVTPYKNAYDDLHRKYDNIEFFSPRAKSSGSIVRHCLHQGRWVILHGGCPPVLFLKPGDYKRIIWRTWGGDVRYTYREGEILRNTGKKILNLCKRLLIRRLYAVGIANTVDKININQAFGHVKTLRIAYPSKEIDNWSEIAYIPSNDDNCINI